MAAFERLQLAGRKTSEHQGWGYRDMDARWTRSNAA